LETSIPVDTLRKLAALLAKLAVSGSLISGKMLKRCTVTGLLEHGSTSLSWDLKHDELASACGSHKSATTKRVSTSSGVKALRRSIAAASVKFSFAA